MSKISNILLLGLLSMLFEVVLSSRVFGEGLLLKFYRIHMISREGGRA